LFGKYDRLIPTPKDKQGCKYVCFTDDPSLKSDFWEIRLVDNDFKSDVHANRYYKMHPHVIFPDNELSVYVDANVRVKRSIADLIHQSLSDTLIAFPKHEHRDCLYLESEVCVEKKNIPLDIVNAQMKRYRTEGFPSNFGLGEMNIIVRKHNEPEIVQLMESWWHTFNSGAQRDQLSFFYLIWKLEINFMYLPVETRKMNKFFFIELHNNSTPWQRVKRSIKRIFSYTV